MPATRNPFRREFRRIREGFADAFRDQRGGDDDRSPPGVGSHVVPSRLTIFDVMEGDLATVSPESPLRAALALMIEHRISSVPVVDAEGRIVGSLAEKDLMKVFYQIGTSSVETVMNREPVTFAIDAPLVDVIDELMSSDFRRVLIHQDGRLVGVITRSHLMPALLEALEAIEIH